MIDLRKITTEKRNVRTFDIDNMETLDVCRAINEEDKSVPSAVEKVLPQIAKAVDAVAARLQHGGRMFYAGAGTSGRLGVLDAAECPPTYGVPADMVQGIIAGGRQAMFVSQEGAEDSEEAAAADLAERGLTAKDAVVALAASGRTPYAAGALRYAKKQGALTVSVTCSADSLLSSYAEIAVEAVTGPEVITGSTRMKAGTAQKLILNMLSTAVMIKLGKVYQNLMVDVRASNAKLRERARRIVMEAAEVDAERADLLLAAAGGRAKPAIVMQLLHVELAAAEELLRSNGGSVRRISSVKQQNNTVYE
ncbi:N-acetylmuramic acid 6-phosphate etherase [Pectinatus haikarae]|uniref:N-acetylmuramic acid 6-phosphate etherase n=1 Tax=Pectinatus haikarae TaxID=349096 RepID=A0ABT9Y4U5_9FIRM|nr:N-acetylmuramic acid 6-phosphate etherase [Pectinatus haikarae]MDQ0202576.1 N-acetylmuramic acid 6-phosphate etherase [Pectinatus haikarae]